MNLLESTNYVNWNYSLFCCLIGIRHLFELTNGYCESSAYNKIKYWLFSTIIKCVDIELCENISLKLQLDDPIH